MQHEAAAAIDRPAVAVALVVDEFERAREALQAYLQDARA